MSIADRVREVTETLPIEKQAEVLVLLAERHRSSRNRRFRQ